MDKVKTTLVGLAAVAILAFGGTAVAVTGGAPGQETSNNAAPSRIIWVAAAQMSDVSRSGEPGGEFHDAAERAEHAGASDVSASD